MCAAYHGTAGKILIVILGPTASGKTRIAIELARYLNTQILSADSRQFYRELRIGTAMPSVSELTEAPHHFVGHLSVHDYYNVSRFETDALKLLSELFAKHDSVVMCGGSGLYISAVSSGIDELPDPDENIRQELKTMLSAQGIAYLQNELLRLDPAYYQQVDLNNPARLIRALEVCLITGKTYSSLRSGKPNPRPFMIIKFGLDVPKDELIEKIRKRTDTMFADGLVEEARALFPLRHLNALKTVGYTELFGYFDGKYSLEGAKEKIITNTWRYAKRQLTWFRKDKEIQWFHPSEIERMKSLIPDRQT